jgi:hypothetical protein
VEAVGHSFDFASMDESAHATLAKAISPLKVHVLSTFFCTMYLYCGAISHQPVS